MPNLPSGSSYLSFGQASAVARDEANPLSVSVIIAVRNGGRYLADCLRALDRSTLRPLEVIVVDDASSDGSAGIARQYGAIVHRLDEQAGSFEARNLAASKARAGLLLFIDADVCVQADTIEKVVDTFRREPDADAVIGSYDAFPGSPDLLSQYRNLVHHWFHQASRREAATFWTGCGAIRRNVFREIGGFMPEYQFVGDIGLGYLLRQNRRRIVLNKQILVKHMKRWSFLDMLRTDIFRRAATWTEMILRFHSIPNDLNVCVSQRVAVVVVFLLPLALLGFLWQPAIADAVFLGGLLAVYTSLTWPLLAFFARRRGPVFALRCLPLFALYNLCCGLGCALGVGRHLLRNRYISKLPVSGPQFSE